jgi:zinc transport system ATP-binding protein
MAEAIVNIDNISFSYGKGDILKNVSSAIYEGDFLGIVGPNGSGKSTLLKIVLGILKPQKGKIKYFGVELNKFTDRSKIGYIPQKATAFNQGFPATVGEVVAANLYPQIGLAGRVTKNHRHKIDEALDTVGMLEFKNRIIGHLSGGQQQRVFIAKALVSQPSIIFMDEPTVGIDQKSEENFYDLMKYLNESKKIILVMVTHDIGAISKRVNRVLCLSEGRLLEHECANKSVGEIFDETYGHHDVARILHEH